MDNRSFFGGIWKRGKDARLRRAPSPEAVNEDWGWVGQKAELFLRGAAASSRLFTWDGLALLVRGYARPRGSQGPLDLERVAEELRCHYLEHGELAVDDLDGSFTLALCDSQAERVLLYRNVIGTGSTYYLATGDGLLFAGNLAELAELSGRQLTPNRDVLPSFFLFRCVPGRETLLSDFQRLLPGEQISWSVRGFTPQQRHTFAHLRGTRIPPSDALDQVEHVLTEVLTDCVAHRPTASNLLSGGVDSSCLQTLIPNPTGMMQNSYSLSVDHPTTWPDREYADSASFLLNTRHVPFPANEAYASYLVEALRTTAEPLNHVQSAYFGFLGRSMRDDGISAGLCGEGADSLFGLGLANQVHNAGVLRWLVPLAAGRRCLAHLTQRFGWGRLAHVFRFANHLTDWSWPDHPVNRVAAFADWGAVEACFGADAIVRATEDRRRLLDQFDVPDDPLERMHAVGLLGEAVDSAGLWATLFHRAGADLLCPFLDSRVLRVALNLAPSSRFRFRRPKDLLKRSLTQRGFREIATRAKLGFGQPIFEWLEPEGQLRPMVDRLGQHEFVPPATLDRVRRKPTWFLYSLLVYDTWHKLFIEQAAAHAIASWRAEAAVA